LYTLRKLLGFFNVKDGDLQIMAFSFCTC